MSWSAPASSDVLSELSAAEATALQTALGGSTVTQKVDPILSRVVAEIRGYIAGGGYPLDPDTTKLPPSLLADAVALCRWRLIVTVPELDEIANKNRKAAADASVRKLTLIADQQLSVEPPSSSMLPATGQWNSENKLIMRTHPIPRPTVQVSPTSTDYAGVPADET